MKIQVTEDTYKLLAEHGDYLFTRRGYVPVKVGPRRNLGCFSGHFLFLKYIFIPPQTMFVGGYTVFTLSVRSNERKCVRDVLFP